MINKLRVYSFLSLVFLLSGCVTVYNPATQKQETLLIDTKDEIVLGRKMNLELERQLTILEDSRIQKRLDRIGSKIISVSDRQDMPYYFRIVKDNEFNAFTIPGGYIYVNSGLIKEANDDELACVLAHEAGHAAARHIAKKMQSDLGYQIVMNIILGVKAKQAMMKTIGLVFNLVSLGYGRKDEFFADKLAVRYAKKSGFSPYGMVTFFQKLKKEAESKGANFTLVFLSSHPPIDERIKNAEKEIANLSD